MKFEFSRHILEKYSNIKFHENLSSGNLVISCGQMDGQTDRHDEGSSRPSQFCESTWRTEVLEFQPFSLRVIEFRSSCRRSSVWNADISALAFTCYCVARSEVSLLKEVIIRVSSRSSWWLWIFSSFNSFLHSDDLLKNRWRISR